MGKDASENLNILNKNFQKTFKSRNKRFPKGGQSKILKIKSFQNILKNQKSIQMQTKMNCPRKSLRANKIELRLKLVNKKLINSQ